MIDIVSLQTAYPTLSPRYVDGHELGFFVSTSRSGSKITILQVPVECARPRELADTATIETEGSLGRVSGTRSGYH